MAKKKQKSPVKMEGGLAGFRMSAIAHTEVIRKLGIDPYPHNFNKPDAIFDIRERYENLGNDESSAVQVTTAGRVTAHRNGGMFIVIEDPSGAIQIYSPDLAELSGPEEIVIRGVKTGDIIGVTGFPARTKRGELSIKRGTITPLATSLLPKLKHHLVEDPEEQVRNRVLHLITNGEARQRLRTRFEIVQRIRRFLEDDGWLEVETPVLQTIPGGAEARPFVTHHNTLKQDMYLRIATELHLKELIVSGIHEKVFEMGRIFRNEGISPKHNPEFTTIELYRAYADYTDMMNLTETLVRDCAENVIGKSTVPFLDQEICLNGDWSRRPMLELIEEETEVAFGDLSEKEAIQAAESMGIEMVGDESWGAVVIEVFEAKCEEKLIQPTFVIDYPAEVCPLTKQHRDNPRLAERFELFISGMEFANAFTELSDPVYQREQFMKQAELREKGDEEAHRLDEDFLRAIEHGFPPTGGLGIGIDRLAMLLTGASNIREIIAFPTLKNR